MKRYRFIAAEQAGRRSVVKACAFLKVSRSAYHEWSQHKPSAHAQGDAALQERIIRIHKASRGTYGAPRVHQQKLI